jgi:hypothetical protein
MEERSYRKYDGQPDDDAGMYLDVRIILNILKKYLLFESIWNVSDYPRKCSLSASCEERNESSG